MSERRPERAASQHGPNVGLVERGTVAPIGEVNDYEYPDASDVISVTLGGTGEGN